MASLQPAGGERCRHECTPPCMYKCTSVRHVRHTYMQGFSHLQNHTHTHMHGDWGGGQRRALDWNRAAACLPRATTVGTHGCRDGVQSTIPDEWHSGPDKRLFHWKSVHLCPDFHIRGMPWRCCGPSSGTCMAALARKGSTIPNAQATSKLIAPGSPC